MTKLMLEPQYSIRLYYSTYTMIVLILYGLYCKLYSLSLCYFCGLLSSLNHWKCPKNDNNRLIDLCIIRGSGLYHYYYSWLIPYTSYFIFYHIWIFLCLMCYCGSCYYRTKNQNVCSIIHMNMHLFGNIAHFILYTGLNQLCL